MTTSAREPRPESKTSALLSFLDPLALGRLTFKRLWRSPGPNARLFIVSSLLWTVPLALTEPYKALYLSRLGLSNLAIGGFFALDMAVRVFGVLLGGLLSTRLGYKRMLIWGDALSWIVPSLTLALAREPWQAYVATCFYATNSLVFAAVHQFMLEDTAGPDRPNTYALLNMVAMLPGALLPFAAGLAIERWGLVGAMRGLLAFQALCMLSGMAWRWKRLGESSATRSGESVQGLLRAYPSAFRHMAAQGGVWLVLAAFVLANLGGGVWRNYFGLYIVQVLGQPASLAGQLTQAGALAFGLSSLLLVPRLSPLKSEAAFLLATGLACLPPLLLGLGPAKPGLFTLAALGGLAGAGHAALLNAFVARLLPKGAEGLAFALCYAGMHLFLAFSYSITGALFETRFSAFPWVALAFSTGLTALAWGMTRQPS